MWDFTDRYARHILASTRALDYIKTGTMVPPESIPERHIRPLAKLEPSQQREAWQKAVETAPGKSMIKSEPDIDAFLDEFEFRSGAFRLWVTVLWNCVKVLKGEKMGSREMAESFIFDSENVFFDLICGQMGVDPDQFRKRVRSRLRK